VKDFLDPAIKGTTGILKAIKAYAPTVKRVVITSSFAAIVNPKQHAKEYSEENWNPVTWEEALDPSATYRGSKVCIQPRISHCAWLTYAPTARLLQKRLLGTLSKKRNPTLTLQPSTHLWCWVQSCIT
jgi:nucleoside-diphosphate-sugar epimerase